MHGGSHDASFCNEVNRCKRKRLEGHRATVITAIITEDGLPRLRREAIDVVLLVDTAPHGVETPTALADC